MTLQVHKCGHHWKGGHSIDAPTGQEGLRAASSAGRRFWSATTVPVKRSQIILCLCRKIGTTGNRHRQNSVSWRKQISYLVQKNKGVFETVLFCFIANNSNRMTVPFSISISFSDFQQPIEEFGNRKSEYRDTIALILITNAQHQAFSTSSTLE